MICEIDGLVLRGVQFGVLVLADWVLFEVLMAVRAHLFKIDGRVLVQFGGAGAGAVLGVTVHACLLHLDGRVHGGMQFGVLVLVVFLGCCLGGSCLRC